MRILHVGPVKPMRSATGVAQSICGMVAAQAAVGLEVGLLSSSPIPSSVSMPEIPGVSLIEGPRKRQLNPWFISRDWIIRIREKFGVPGLVDFHSTYIPFHIALARRCRQVGWPYIITAHGGMGYLAQGVKRPKKAFGNLIYFRSYVKHAAAVHALCEREAKEIQALFNVKNIITVPNGVDDYLLDAWQKLSPANLGGFGQDTNLMLGFVGRIDVYHKGLDLLLKALAILKSRPNRNTCKLFVIGPFYTKQDEQSFRSAVESLGLKDDVKLFGPKNGEEKLRYFLACDVFVHTSRFEGMPMAVLEAMALGRPCLVTPGTNIADIVREAGGWECEPNPESIAGTIESIYEKRDSLQLLGQQARGLIQARFTWPLVARRLSDAYTRLCDFRREVHGDRK